jgi:hypothetical protein
MVDVETATGRNSTHGDRRRGREQNRMTAEIPFPEVSGQPTAQHIAVAPDGTMFVVPSGSHDRLRTAVVEESTARDPSVDLALSGWTCLQSDGLTDRVNVDVPDRFIDAHLIRQFARAHDAGSVAVARHPSGEVIRSNNPRLFAFNESTDG